MMQSASWPTNQFHGSLGSLGAACQGPLVIVHTVPPRQPAYAERREPTKSTSK